DLPLAVRQQDEDQLGLEPSRHHVATSLEGNSRRAAPRGHSLAASPAVRTDHSLPERPRTASNRKRPGALDAPETAGRRPDSIRPERCGRAEFYSVLPSGCARSGWLASVFGPRSLCKFGHVFRLLKKFGVFLVGPDNLLSEVAQRQEACR